MFKGKKILAVIPARGGSKGLPRKNIQLLAGRPLIAYSIENGLRSRYVDRVVVSTDDIRIAEVARENGAEVPFLRPKELAADSATLDATIFHAFSKMSKRGFKADIVVTLQPTSPLLRPASIDKAIEKLFKEKADSVISVTEDRHLFWEKKGKLFRPIYKERRNRQFLRPLFRESGAFLVSRKEALSKDDRLGKKVCLLVMGDESESIDIHTLPDLWLAGKVMFNQKVLFRVEGFNEIGLGHIYRCMAIAAKMPAAEILFLLSPKSKKAVRLVRSHGFEVKIFNKGEEFRKLKEFKPQIIVNDILDTGKGYMEKIKNTRAFIVNFEDLGEGAEEADLVINALYGTQTVSDKYYSGPRYVCLRDEFKNLPPKKIREKVKKTMILFGGCDENNLTLKAAKAIAILPDRFSVDVVLGLGYRRSPKEIEKVFRAARRDFKIYRSVEKLSYLMMEADIVITGYGRTVYEVATTRTPVIAMAQNQRELLHPFISEENGVIGLGPGKEVTIPRLAQEIKALVDNSQRRKLLSIKMEKAYDDFGAERVISLILEKYRARKNADKNRR